MEGWNGKTSIGRDLLNRVVKVTDHKGREISNALSELFFRGVNGISTPGISYFLTLQGS